MKTLVGTPDPADDWGSGKDSFGGDWAGAEKNLYQPKLKKHKYLGDARTQSREAAPYLIPGDAAAMQKKLWDEQSSAINDINPQSNPWYTPPK